MDRLPRLSGLVLALGLAAAAPAFAGPAEDERARKALRVLQDIQKIPESSIPDKLLDEARAIVIVPDTLKIGLVVGGRRGHGVMAVKNADGTFNFICEIPKETKAKMEVATDEEMTPIK